MATLTASEKAHMARSQGVNYDVRTDQYVFPDGTRVDASSVAQQSQQLHQMQQQISNGWAQAQPLGMGVMGGSLEPVAEREERIRKSVIQEIVEKIKTKYEGRDLIMVKTADLIREIERL